MSNKINFKKKMKLLFFVFFSVVFCSLRIQDEFLYRNEVIYKYTGSFKRSQEESFPLSFIIQEGRGFTLNTKAKTQFYNSVKIWEILLNQTQVNSPIEFSIDFKSLPTGVIGSTNNVMLSIDCDSVFNKLGVFDMCNNVKFNMKNNVVYDNQISITKANAKALRIENIDIFGNRDGSIEFNSGFRFDFDLSDGLDPSLTDFMSVVIHEIGHMLGFISDLDDLDIGILTFTPTILDFYRFKSENDVERETRFSIKPHFFIKKNYVNVTISAKFSTGYYNGDGNQASHWGADELYLKYIGVMDPTLYKGTRFDITTLDILAFKTIGYTVNRFPNPIIHFLNYKESRNSVNISFIADLILNKNYMCKYNNNIKVLQKTAETFYYCYFENVYSFQFENFLIFF